MKKILKKLRNLFREEPFCIVLAIMLVMLCVAATKQPHVFDVVVGIDSVDDCLPIEEAIEKSSAMNQYPGPGNSSNSFRYGK